MPLDFKLSRWQNPNHVIDDPVIFNNSVFFRSGTPWIDAKAYGAKGDGITIDSTSLQAAITAGVGSTVYLPPGTYIWDTTISIPSNIHIRGAGMGITTLKLKNGSSTTVQGWTGTNVTNVTFSDLTFDLNKANQSDGGSDAQQMAIYLYASTGVGTSNCHLSRVEVKNGKRHGVVFDVLTPGSHTLDVAMEDCRVTGNARFGVYCRGGFDFKAINNTVSTNTLAGIVIDNGIRSTTIGNECNSNGLQGITYSSSVLSKNFVCVGNVCNLNAGGTGVAAGIVASIQSDQFTISNNICDANEDHGIAIDVGTVGAPTSLQECQGVVSGNVCTNTTNNHGIYAQNVLGLGIVGNQCYGNLNGYGIQVVGSRCVIDANACRGNKWGLGLQHDAALVPATGSHYLGNNMLEGNVTANFVEGVGAAASKHEYANGVAATATTPGTVVKKIEMFNEEGTSLGFVPIYDAIT